MLETFERYFDRLLVHGDPAFLPFERTFGHAARLGDRLCYTGYVVEPAPPAASDTGSGEVIVSAGGGAVGARLLETAIMCRSRTTLAGRGWRVLAGVNAEGRVFEKLRALAARSAEGGIVVERSREDFRTLLRNSSLSVSQLGYNTLMEILEAGVRAVAVPFAGGAETEQRLRGRLLAARGRIELLEEDELTPEKLAAAVDRAAAAPVPAPGPSMLDLGGAARSAELLEQWLAERAP
jgi:predicted glycosyltransferase